MEKTVLEKSSLFRGIPEGEIREILEAVPHHVRNYERGETVFYLLDPADRVGIILEGAVQAQKSFPDGSQVNVSVRRPGGMIGPAAAFSADRRYPCDIVALEPASILMFRREEILALMQKDLRILENFTTEIASAAYMLQQRLELLSYSGIVQKAAFYLLMKARQTGKLRIPIPGSMSAWALFMNVSRPSLHRELKKLEDRGIISYRPPVIGILDQDALQKVLN